MLGMTSYRDGAVAVVEAMQTRHRISLLLRELDGNLFVERQRTIAGEDVWCVVEHVGSEVPPVTVLEWRDTDGCPIPYLTEGIVDRMRERHRLLLDTNARTVAETACRRADSANERLRERREAESRAAYTEITAEYLRIAKRGGTFHRSAGLSLSRRRERDRKARELRVLTGRQP